MSQEVFPYDDLDNAYITVQLLDEPYGPGSRPVISIGSTLKGDIHHPSWKVHVPCGMAKNVADAILRAATEAPPEQ
jgi:hypothetical protein